MIYKSATMMVTVGLEHTSSINTDLTWKNVSKGYRSRRLRKSIAKGSKLDAELVEKNSGRMSLPMVSESEKEDVAFAGQHFSGKIEHVPIKKRKFHSGSPSMLPSSSSSLQEDSNDLSDSQYSSHHHSSPELAVKQRRIASDACLLGRLTSSIGGSVTQLRNENLGCYEDFSGIEMLAAAACSNMDDETKHCELYPVSKQSAQDRSDALASQMPVKEANTSINAAYSSPVDNNCEERTKGSCFSDTAVNAPCHVEKETNIQGSVSLRDERFPWDLNVAIDAWEQPCDVPGHDIQTGTMQDVPEAHKQSEQDYETCRVKECGDGVGNITAELQPDVKKEENVDGSAKEDVCYGGLPESSANVAIDAKADGQVVNALILEEGKDSQPQNIALKRMDDACVQLSRSEGVENPEKSLSGGLFCERNGETVITNENGQNRNIVSVVQVKIEFPEESNAVQGCHSRISESMLNCKTEENCEVMHVLGASTTDEGEPLAAVNSEEEAGEPSLGHIARLSAVVGSECVTCDEPSRISSVGAKSDCISQETALEYEKDSASLEKSPATGSNCDRFKLNTIRDEHVVGKENTVEPNSDMFNLGTIRDDHYDNQYEDGEFWESDLHYSEEEPEEEMDIDRVEYDSDGCDEYNVDAFACSSSGKDKTESEHNVERSGLKNLEGSTIMERGLSTGSGNITENIEPCPGQGIMDDPVGSRSENNEPKVPDGVRMSDNADVAEFTAKEVASVAKKSCDEESLSPSSTHKNPLIVRNDRSHNVSLCDRARSDSISDLEPCELPKSNSSFVAGRQRPRSVIESQGGLEAADQKTLEAVRVAGANNTTCRQSTSSFPSGPSQQFRRRLVAFKSDANGMQRGVVPLRTGSPNGRRLRGYPHGTDRGIREDYRKPRPYEMGEYCMPNPLMTRERSFSPSGRGHFHYPRPYHQKSWTRSRSRSPFSSWVSQKERNEGFKHHRSRSPVYSSASRVERMRFPLEKSFPADYDMTLISSLRHRLSPRRNPGWADNMPGDVANFRERRLPFRMLQQGRRFPSMQISRRPNPQGYFEPVIHPGRFSEANNNSTGGDYGCEGREGARKRHGNGYEVMPHLRRNNDGAVRRLHYNAAADGGFAPHNPRTYEFDRDADRRCRDPVRRANEESRFRYNREKIFESYPCKMQDS